jgi:hypothetical protein
MKPSSSRLCLVLAGPAIAVALAACGGDGSSESLGCAGSSFTAAVYGANVNPIETFSGKACWSQSGSDWALGLYAASGTERIVIGRETGGAPSSGANPLSGFGTRAILSWTTGKTWVCSNLGAGSLNITSQTGTTFSGSVSDAFLICQAGPSDPTTPNVTLQVTQFFATQGSVTSIP